MDGSKPDLLGGLLPPPAPILPEWLLEFNLLEGLIWYITVTFFISIGLRIRFYRSVVRIAQHLSISCPKVYRLIQQHKMLIVEDNILGLGVGYVGILGIYQIVTRLLWTDLSMSVSQLAHAHPAYLVLNLVLAGVMFSLDYSLILQVSAVDEDRVKNDLSFAERWLGSQVYQWLDLLGKWNPIKRYADSKARESMRWFNEVFRNSLALMIVQVTVRVLLAILLFLAFMAGI